MASERSLRSHEWFRDQGRNGFIHRSWLKGDGLPDEAFDGRPVVGIANTWSQLTPCNSNLRRVSEFVARGVWEAGGLPLEFPVMSLPETLMRPSSMMYRNLLSMELEEQLRANPIDSVVLLGGCDKTIPGLLMGAASVNLPSLVVSSGPKLNGKWQGEEIGSGVDIWKFVDLVRTGKMTQEEFVDAERCMARSEGHCMTMASASTMAVIAETIGLQLPGGAAIPGVDSRRYLLAHETGRQAVTIAKQGLNFADLVTPGAIENAVKVVAAIGGSTNAFLHLLALSGRLGYSITQEDFDRWSAEVPMLLNLKPAGKYLMEDFYYAGGAPVVLKEILPWLNANERNVLGQTLAEAVSEAENYNTEVITTVEKPLKTQAGIAVLHGNLAPNGAIIKLSAANPDLLRHRGKALVFEAIEDLEAVIDDMDLDVDADTVLVVRNSGPRGYPGMPEIGNLPMPKKLLFQGINDMVRISDARMSGSSYGTVVLHVAPEAAIGGPLGLIRTGDFIELDVQARSLRVDLSDEELEARRAEWRSPLKAIERGYLWLHHEYVTQADQGADLSFLVGGSGHEVPRRPF